MPTITFVHTDKTANQGEEILGYRKIVVDMKETSWDGRNFYAVCWVTRSDGFTERSTIFPSQIEEDVKNGYLTPVN